MQGDIELPLGNNTYVFNVAKHKQLFELQDKCGVIATGAEGEIIPIPSGPLEILNRLRTGTWREADVVWPIELGLVGAGMPVVEKNKIVTEFVRDVPKGELVPLAARILFAAIYGVEPLKKKNSRKKREKVDPANASQDPLHTEQAQS